MNGNLTGKLSKATLKYIEKKRKLFIYYDKVTTLYDPDDIQALIGLVKLRIILNSKS